jgi:UDP-glucose 4-epimerase
MKKILITGGAGYIGSHMVHFLISKGYNPKEIIVFDNLEFGHKEHLPEEVEFIRGDLRNSEEIEFIFRNNDIFTVFHFAAYAYVGESMNHPEKYFENNCTGGFNLLRAMRKNHCSYIIFSSSCATYGIPEKMPISEKELQNPINPYGESKLIFEKMLKWFEHAYQIKSVSLRYFNVGGAGFGIGEKHEPETHLIPLIIKTALGEKESITIFGNDYDTPDRTCIRDYIHIIDLCDAHYKAMDFLLRNNLSEVFNLGTGKGTSVKEVIDKLKKISNKDFRVVATERRKGDPAVLIADYKKAEKILGWKAERSIDEIIKSAWDWHKK